MGPSRNEVHRSLIVTYLLKKVLCVEFKVKSSILLLPLCAPKPTKEPRKLFHCSKEAVKPAIWTF